MKNKENPVSYLPPGLKKFEKRVIYSSFFLLLILILSYIPIFNHKDKAKSVETAVLNPKHAQSVYEIDFYENSSNKAKITLKKEGELWLIQAEQFLLPAKQEEVHRFLERISRIQKFYKISDSDKSLKKLNLLEKNNSDFYLTVKYREGNDGIEKKSEVLFNFEKKSSGKVFARSLSNSSAFEIQDSKLISCLTAQVSFWAENSIVPQGIFSKNNSIQRILLKKNALPSSYEKVITEKKDLSGLLSLTSGQFFSDRDYLQNNKYKSIYSIKVEFGDASEIIIEIIPYKVESYVLLYNFLPSPYINKKNAGSLKKINYAFTISSWTLQNILSVFNENTGQS